MNGNPWKWIAGIMAAFMLGSAIPALGWFIDSFNEPSQAQVDLIYERQQLVLQRLAVIEVKLVDLQMQIDDIQVRVEQHTQGGR